MAYRKPVISPSSLAATELCPRYRPDGKENDAALEGTMLHECLEHMVEQPPDLWESWITAQEVSVEHKGLLEEAASQLRTIIEPGMQVFPERKLKPRYRKGKLLNQTMKPGLYPELEVQTAPGRHGYIDLLIVLSSGIAVIVDYKFERQEKLHDLQLARYALCILDYVPTFAGVEARIIAPRIKGDEIERYMWGKEELERYRERIEAIEDLADRSANDLSIHGCPSDACQFCHWAGTCPYQANAAIEVSEVTDVVSKVMVPAGPYAGETLTKETFMAPATPAQRGLRRACIKFLKSAIENWTEDDKTWSSDHRDEQTGAMTETVPGWTISWCRGRASLDRTRETEIHQAVMAKLNMSLEDIFAVCEVNVSKLVEDVVRHEGCTDADAKEKVNRILDPFMTYGAGYPTWRQVGARRKPRKASEVEAAIPQ